MAKAKFMNGEFSAKFKGKRRFVAEQMEAIKDYAARDDMQINICPVIQERPSGKKNTEEQITPTHFISGNLEHAVVAIYDNAGIPSFMHRFRKATNKELFGGSDKTNAAFIIGDEEYDEIYISVYENCEINGKPYSLPMQKPWTGITNDEAARACFSKGEGWHLMTRAEWGLLANLSLKMVLCHMATRTMESTMQTRKNMESQQENPERPKPDQDRQHGPTIIHWKAFTICPETYGKW